MIPLGIGGIVGSAFIGYVIDKHGSKITIIVYFIVLTIGYVLAFAQLALNEYTVLIYFMTFVWGFQDSV